MDAAEDIAADAASDATTEPTLGELFKPAGKHDEVRPLLARVALGGDEGTLSPPPRRRKLQSSGTYKNFPGFSGSGGHGFKERQAGRPDSR